MVAGRHGPAGGNGVQTRTGRFTDRNRAPRPDSPYIIILRGRTLNASTGTVVETGPSNTIAADMIPDVTANMTGSLEAEMHPIVSVKSVTLS